MFSIPKTIDLEWANHGDEKEVVELIANGVRFGADRVPWLLGKRSRLVSFVEFHYARMNSARLNSGRRRPRNLSTCSHHIHKWYTSLLLLIITSSSSFFFLKKTPQLKIFLFWKKQINPNMQFLLAVCGSHLPYELNCFSVQKNGLINLLRILSGLRMGLVIIVKTRIQILSSSWQPPNWNVKYLKY